MTIGQRIKARRSELNLSVDELALKLGKNRATVYRYEKDDIKDLPITVLEPLAKVLETTPADLMGWGEISNDSIISLETEINNISSISKREKACIKKYFKLTETNRKKADNYVNQLLSIQEMENDLMVQAAHERTDIEVTDEMRKHDDDLMDGEW